jgi:hypothetical protein
VASALELQTKPNIFQKTFSFITGNEQPFDSANKVYNVGSNALVDRFYSQAEAAGRVDGVAGGVSLKEIKDRIGVAPYSGVENSALSGNSLETLSGFVGLKDLTADGADPRFIDGAILLADFFTLTSNGSRVLLSEYRGFRAAAPASLEKIHAFLEEGYATNSAEPTAASKILRLAAPEPTESTTATASTSSALIPEAQAEVPAVAAPTDEVARIDGNVDLSQQQGLTAVDIKLLERLTSQTDYPRDAAVLNHKKQISNAFYDSVFNSQASAADKEALNAIVANQGKGEVHHSINFTRKDIKTLSYFSVDDAMIIIDAEGNLNSELEKKISSTLEADSQLPPTTTVPVESEPLNTVRVTIAEGETISRLAESAGLDLSNKSEVNAYLDEVVNLNKTTREALNTIKPGDAFHLPTTVGDKSYTYADENTSAGVAAPAGDITLTIKGGDYMRKYADALEIPADKREAFYQEVAAASSGVTDKDHIIAGGVMVLPDAYVKDNAPLPAFIAERAATPAK